MVLQINSLKCGYDAPLFTLDALALSDGDAITVVGQNGSGKSTLLRTLCGLIAPLDGGVRVDGSHLSSLDARMRAQKITMLMQMQSLDNGTSVHELVCLGRTPYLGRFAHLSGTDKSAVDEAIDICDLRGLAYKPLGRISGGERQRARLAMVLAQQTRIVLLDEPTNHLDVSHRHALYTIIEHIREERGCVVVMVCHSLEDAKRFAERTMLIHRGQTKLFHRSDFDALKIEIQQNTGVPADWVY
ncbi:MAG: ABC transporter ATP-binding protein [Deltaproteobacteria bacterium]|nr:ABC transporter ATP-binding protein [Deltaproteobacteria bacterium]MBN2673301.1 ABC transporter ATP-binding protein [Deltaproteobacteria bacterium]